MRILIIGAAGFVGGHLINYLNSVEDGPLYVTRLPNEFIENANIKEGCNLVLDVCDENQVENLLRVVKPEYIFHLAAQSSVSLSWKEPALTYKVNVVGSINILESIRRLQLKSRILIIGSAEEYGQVKLKELPISEDTKIMPSNPYAISKVSQEMISLMYVETYAMDIVMVRAFNHIGPGQSPVFVISDFAKQIAEIESGKQEPRLLVGNLDAKRDLSDVRDIVRGYWALMQKGIKGEVYNIGTGVSYRIMELLETMIDMSSCKIEIIVDPKKFRPSDIPELRANITKITRDVMWEPKISISTSLKDILDYWRSKC